MKKKTMFGLLTALLVHGASAMNASYVWLEGESGQTDIPVNNAGWGNAEFLSQGKWMQVLVEADKVATVVPANGAIIRYPFSLDAAGSREVWGRIGYEFARSPFEWRVDNGDWRSVSPQDLT
ncbi:MAG: hypothetical protein PHW08_05015, partial [Kiritimatiellae bacterium]|nr:hypothetical protein [Kiritimatiellia bacterium]